MTDAHDSAVLLLALAKTCETLAQRIDGDLRFEDEELTNLVAKADVAVNAVTFHLDEKNRVFQETSLT